MSHTRPHSETILRRLEEYRRQVLAPAGLDVPENAKLHHSFWPEVFVYEGEERVWKFYGARRAHQARNTAKASRLLRGAGLRTPEILYADAGSATVKQHGVACLMMERVRGDYFDPRDLMNRETALAPLLARMHAISSDQWGALTWRGGPRSPEELLAWHADTWTRELEPLLGPADQPPLTRLRARLVRQAPALLPPDGRFPLVQGDVHESNILRSSDGALHLIDLDFAGYGAFGLDLALLIQRNNPAMLGDGEPDSILESWESDAAPFLQSYFEAAPASFADAWKRMRNISFLYLQLRLYIERLRLRSPEDCAPYALDFDEVIEDRNRRRRLIDRLLGP